MVLLSKWSALAATLVDYSLSCCETLPARVLMFRVQVSLWGPAAEEVVGSFCEPRSLRS